MKDHFPHDFDEELDGDTVWDLLENSPTSEAPATFVQDTLRRARLEADSAKPWWQALLSPKLILGTTVAACAAFTLVISLDDPAPQAEPSLADDPTAEEWNELEDAVANELLVGVTEDPSLLSDEEIVALIF